MGGPAAGLAPAAHSPRHGPLSSSLCMPADHAVVRNKKAVHPANPCAPLPSTQGKSAGSKKRPQRVDSDSDFEALTAAAEVSLLSSDSDGELAKPPAAKARKTAQGKARLTSAAAAAIEPAAIKPAAIEPAAPGPAAAASSPPVRHPGAGSCAGFELLRVLGSGGSRVCPGNACCTRSPLGPPRRRRPKAELLPRPLPPGPWRAWTTPRWRPFGPWMPPRLGCRPLIRWSLASCRSLRTCSAPRMSRPMRGKRWVWGVWGPLHVRRELAKPAAGWVEACLPPVGGGAAEPPPRATHRGVRCRRPSHAATPTA